MYYRYLSKGYKSPNDQQNLHTGTGSDIKKSKLIRRETLSKIYLGNNIWKFRIDVLQF